jgi:hypothetical protein
MEARQQVAAEGQLQIRAGLILELLALVAACPWVLDLLKVLLFRALGVE